MKVVTIVLAALTATLALVVLAGCGGEGRGTEQGTAAVPFDQAFIDAMVLHHQEAIAAAKEAKAAGLAEPELVKIADAIIATQQAEIDDMLAWREDWFGSSEVSLVGLSSLGLSMEEMGMQHDPADLATAEDIDAAFASMMIDHHSGAIAMAQLALERGTRPEIRELAQAIIDAQQREVETLMEYGGEGMGHMDM